MLKNNLIKVFAAILACTLLLPSCEKETELSLSDKVANFEAAGTLEKVITVTTNVEWAVACEETWVSVLPASGVENGTFTIKVTENTAFEPRSAIVTVTAKEKIEQVKVTQLSPAPSLAISPETVEKMDNAGGKITVEITSNAPWSVVLAAECDWITPSVTSGNGSGSVELTVAANVARAERSANVTFKETVANTEKVLAVSQEMGPTSRLSDSLALVALRTASGAFAKNDWDLSTSLEQWKGVSVREGRVTAIKLGTKTITAAEWELPAIIADLDMLDTLNLPSNKVKGDFPEVIYELKKLKSLDLSGNNITGGLSAKIGQLTDLEYITMLNNADFAGTIPDEIGNLKKLFRVNFSNTKLGGSIPAALAGCTNLQEFMAFTTSLSGELPDIWDQFHNNFKIIMLNGNAGLTGPLPASLGNIVSNQTTISLHLYNCNFTGNIPESFANLPAGAKQLRVQGNRLSGTVPAAVKAHANWTTWKAETYIFPQQDGYGLN